MTSEQRDAAPNEPTGSAASSWCTLQEGLRRKSPKAKAQNLSQPNLKRRHAGSGAWQPFIFSTYLCPHMMVVVKAWHLNPVG
jgi:hypothetical protein